MVVIVIGCALFVTSQHGVTANSRFKCNVLAKFFDTMHIIIHALSLFIVVWLNMSLY